ncbi:amino acid/amide ABC transporter ATP-binding protein 1 (HAAT family) [Pseudaminobacter salicylatoxidans]|uniref:Amino acid/amide ABC transporter ATP-binding protein 1 (HAAT family) n=1 Tax=Pseudaminobacter salicylatoxidans TaxID=93369 RepID=A0A316C1T1_PSESE|nr:ABC transporter ATP-binding protein [Pseudaminobacter salicylatoxidans]PWJ82413.1 amino acid/amide ABC transporter ATP-binding protein 1 (HAAT family) [Pseudaminobacter salicylatoxidans]
MVNQSLKANSVTVEFVGLRALDNVSLTLNRREILGLIGPNGSGKTTLINVLTGQVKPVSGTVTCDGEDISALLPRERALRGILRSFQTVRLFSNLTVEENIEVAAIAKGSSRRAAGRIVDRLLEEFSLGAYRAELASSLNYGDERRVEIARALAAEPKYLLLDEPAAGMNEDESATLMQVLARLPQERDLGIIIIDHDMPLIMRLCHRLQAIAQGKTIGEGGVDEVRRLPAVIEAYLGADAVESEDHA